MSSRAEAEEERCRYKGVRRRRWGKWVSEIRVPGTRERLWLGSYATPEGAAVAHDTAVYFLRGGGSIVRDGGGAAALNFPERAAAMYASGSVAPLSPRSVQSVASDAGMAADAQLVAMRDSAAPAAPRQYAELRADAGAAHGGGANAYSYTYMDGGYTPGPGSSGGSEQLLPGDISVDDMEILM